MDTVTGPLSESTTARVRQEDAARRANRAAENRAAENRAAGNRTGNRGGSHRAAPGRGSARTKIAVASTASLAGLSALVTGMTLSNPPGDANNGAGGPSVEAASLPGAFSAGAGQASRADRADDAPVTPQVPAAPPAYQGEEQPLPDPGSAEDYGDTYGTYDSYVPSTGDVVGESIPVFPLTDTTGQDGSQLPYTGDVPTTTGTTQPPWTPPGTQPQPTTSTPTTTTRPTTPAPTPSTGYPTTTPSTTLPSSSQPPSSTPSTSATPTPSGTALPFEPEDDDDIVVDIPIFGLTPTSSP